MDLSQGKFVDDTNETILVNDKVVNGYGSDTPHVAKLRYGVNDSPSTYAKQQDEANTFVDRMVRGLSFGAVESEEDLFAKGFTSALSGKSAASTITESSQTANIAANVATAGASTLTSMYYGAEMAGATLPTYFKNVGMGYKYFSDLLFKSEEERNSPEYLAQWGERAKVEDAVTDTVKEIHKRSEEVAQKIGATLGVGEDSIGAFVGQTTGSVLASLGICYATRSPALTAMAFSLPTYENVLGTSVEKGKDFTTSAGIAFGAGTLTGILENWGFQNFIENIATKTVRGAILKTQTTEAIEELSQQITEDVPLIFWAKDEKFVDENGKIKWMPLLVDLASATFGGWLGGGIGAAGGAAYTQNKINNTIDNLVKTEKYTRGEAETIVNYLVGNDEKARTIYDNEVVGKQIGEVPSYEEFVLANTELKQARNVMDTMAQDMADPKNAEKVISETMNEVLDPVNLPNESLDEYARMVKDSKAQLDEEAQRVAKEERSKHDVRDIVQSKGADTRTIDATREAVQSFAEAEAETFGVTPREALEGKTLTVANLADNSGLSPDEKQQILQQSGLANADTVVAKESGVAPTQDEIDEAYAMMESEKEQGYVPNEYMQGEQDVAQRMNEIDAEEQANGVPEYTAPTININGVERQTKNSDGNPIAKSEKSLRYFYDWFGDSKVVDEQGRPLVVYHGGKKGIKKFSKKLADTGMFFFTNKEGLAEEYRGYNEEDLEKTEVYPVYLAIKNPLLLTGKESLKTFADIIHPQNEILRNKWLENEQGRFDDWTKEYSVSSYIGQLSLLHREKIADYAEKNGYDGVFDYEPTVRGGFEDEQLGFIAFNPNQIKSVDNRGTWSGSPNIYLQSEQDIKDLYATHNMSLAGVTQALKMGGFAMPSLALRKTSQGNINQFGDVVFVGDENMVKPSRSTEVYDRDAWTPNLGYAVRYDLGPATNTFINNVLERAGQRERASVFRYNIEENIDSPKSNQMAIELYALDKGIEENFYEMRDSEDYLDWYDEHILSQAEPYLWTENDSNTDMIKRKFTLNNMMKILRKQERSGGGFIGDYIFDVYKLLQYKSQKFKNLQDIRKNKHKLVSTQEQFDMNKSLNDEFLDLAEKLKKDGVEYDYGDATYGLGLALLQENDERIKYWLDYKKLKSDESSIKSVKDFVKKMQNNVVTDYFEVKPRRIVDFGEFSGVIIPKGKQYDAIAQTLGEKYYLPVERVEKGNEEEYEKALQNIQEKHPKTFFQQEQQPRAFINFQDEANILVGMLNSADVSALPHEMVHGFTRLHVQNCIKYGKFESIKGIMDYFGVTDPMQLITNVDIQERLARMGIKYVQESEAPTAGLRRYFEMFKRFGKKLVSSWQSKGLIDQDALPDEVRDFFDSLLGKNKKEKIDYARIAEQKADVIQAIKRIRAGEAVDISGLPISEVRKLMKVLQSRIPRMPQNLKNALIQAGGIDKEWAKNFDFEAASGEEKNYQLFKRNGAIDSEDSLISFLEGEGFISRTEIEDYDSKSEQWDRVMDAMENMDKTYREADMERVLEREGLEEGIQQARDIISGVGAEDAFEVIENIDALKGRVVAEKEYLDSLERKVKNLDKDYKKLYDQLLKDQLKESAQETKEQVKQAKEELKDYRNQVVDFIKKQDLDLKDKAKLISLVKKANTNASFEKVINEVRERAANLYRKEQVRRLSDLIDKEVSTKRPALKNQKYAYEENKLFSDLREWNNLTKAEAGIRYEAMHNDEEFMGNLTREDEIRLLFLEHKALGADASTQLLNTLLDYIQMAKRVGLEARNEQEYQKAMSLDDTKNEMLQQLKERKGKPGLYIKFVSNLYSSLYTIFGKNIADKYELETVQNKANIKAAKQIDVVVKEAMRLYGVKSKGEFLNILAELGKKAATITTVNNKIDTPLSKVGITRELSTLEIMDIYNAIKNEKTRDDYYYWYGKDQIDTLLSKLTDREMLWADMMAKSIDERYAPVNESFVKNYYTDLPKVDNYWPATTEHKEVKTVFDVQGDFNQQSPSFLKERVKSRVLPKPTNAYTKYTKHIKGTYWVTEMADKQVELLNALSSLRVKNAIENKLGKDTYAALKRQVENLSFGGLMEDVDYVTGIIDKAINNVVVAKISLGIPVFTGQLSSVGLYAENMGTTKWATEFAKGLAHPVETYKFMKEYAGEFLEARFGGGYDETIESVIRESEDGKAKYSLSPKAKYNIMNALTSFVRTGDIGAIIYGGYPRLKQLLETMPREEAVKVFEKETLRGQQASVAASKSAFQQRKGMTRIFTSFRNFQYQAVRKIVDSVYGYMNGEVSAAQAGKTIVLYALYSPIAYELFRQLGNMLFVGADAFKDIGNKLFETIMMQELSIVPIANDVVNYALKKYNKQYAKSGLRTVGVDDLFRAIDKVYKKKKDVYDYAEIVSPFIEMTTGAPSQRIISTTKKVLEKYK